MSALSFGSLDPVLASSEAGRRVLGSAGPVSDAFLAAAHPVMLLNGPQGSAKTTTCIKKVLVEASRMRPGPDGVRRYVVGVWRQKYDPLWKATIPSWQGVLPPAPPVSNWTGASPRSARHDLVFRDAWGEIRITAHFVAFGEQADPDDLRGWQFTDVYLNEWDTLPEDLFIALIGRIGRDPPFSISGRQGRIYGDCNAPDVTSYVYRDFFEAPKDGYRLFRQPGGFEHDAENIPVIGREYYVQQARLNAHRPWWVRRMIHNRPGFVREVDVVYPRFDDVKHVAPERLRPSKETPIVVGVDGGLTPAAAFTQETADGQKRVLAELATERASVKEFARALNAVVASRFAGCELVGRGDPAAKAGEDTEEGSWLQRLSKETGVHFRPAATNDVGKRHDAVRDVLRQDIEPGRPEFLVDPSCKGLIRGFLQTYALKRNRATNDLTSVMSTFDTHVHDALQYAALEWGTATARQRGEFRERDKRERREAGRRNAPERYSPMRRGP